MTLGRFITKAIGNPRRQVDSAETPALSFALVHRGDRGCLVTSRPGDVVDRLK